MLVFAALWGHCDKSGNFEWKPRMLKLDILPFLDFDMATTLEILRDAGFVGKYDVDGAAYGNIPTFGEHQRISGKEAQEPNKYPDFPGISQLFPGEAPEKLLPVQERKGREKEGKGVVATATSMNFEQFSQACKDRNEKTLPSDDPIFVYAEKVKLPVELLRLCWREFSERYRENGKRQKGMAGWRQTFRNCVRSNWYHLWFKDERGDWSLTTAGQQAKRAYAEQRVVSADTHLRAAQ